MIAAALLGVACVPSPQAPADTGPSPDEPLMSLVAGASLEEDPSRGFLPPTRADLSVTLPMNVPTGQVIPWFSDEAMAAYANGQVRFTVRGADGAEVTLTQSDDGIEYWFSGQLDGWPDAWVFTAVNVATDEVLLDGYTVPAPRPFTFDVTPDDLWAAREVTATWGPIGEPHSDVSFYGIPHEGDGHPWTDVGPDDGFASLSTADWGQPGWWNLTLAKYLVAPDGQAGLQARSHLDYFWSRNLPP